ncbi:hypothetical protein CEP52_007446 [Fusarium oligoseptatum]|uniref:Uncharacterized protein n=1 Tax=Fusarium oligoseptatum TaxID=2604345 RepID=A0A428TMU3_9HYPO|nr:hypothetical protein CEP52_007446 [Fusarium oligoseptatum]
MASYEAIRNMPVSPIQSPRPDQGSLNPSLDAPSRYEALPSDDTEANHSSEPAVDPLPPSISIPISPKTRTRSQHLYDRLGYSGLLVLVLGSAVIFISSAILVFLWTGADDARNRRRQPKFWNDIVFRDWSTRVVTICSAVIRISLAFQIGFITAAMSAVMLETSRCRFRDLATLSIQRASSTNASPSNVLPAAFRQCITTGLSGFCYVLIVSISFAIALMSTFTSTILLSDFGTSRAAAPSTTNIIPLGINSTLYDSFDDFEIGISSYFKSRPSAHWRFAEAKRSQASSRELGDTGDVYRALLPFSSPDARASLEYYSGPGLINNHRTVCVGPKIGKIKLNRTKYYQELFLEGTLSAERDKLINLSDPHGDPVEMGCRLEGIWNDDKHWPLSTCELNTGELTHDHFEDLYPDDYLKDSKDEISGQRYYFYPIMLINASASLKTIPSGSLRNLSSTTDRLWTRVYVNKTQVLNATVCFVNTRPLPMFHITMSGRPVSSEPMVDWRRLSSRKNSTGHLQQIGIGLSPDDFERRGILDLQIQPGVDHNDIEAFEQHERLLHSALSEVNPSKSWNLVTNVTYSGFFPWTSHPQNSALVQEVLRVTQDPAQAIQALAFRFSQMLYYAHQPRFNIRRPVTTIGASEMLIPTQWTGLSVVLATLSVHFIVLNIATILFVLCTKASLLGNAWQVISQMISPETKEVMDTPSVDTMRDKDVEEWAKTTGRDSQVYHLSRSDGRGRTEVHLR